MRRMRTAAVVATCALTLALAIAVRAPAASANAIIVVPTAEAEFVARTNALRAEHGLPALAVDEGLQAKARDWAERMAGQRQISHSHLPDNVFSDWHRLGENVGTGPSVAGIHTALVNSPRHLANLLDPGFRYVGIGVVDAYGTFYVSEVFMELASQPAQSAPAPAAGTSDESAAPAAPSAPVAAVTPAGAGGDDTPPSDAAPVTESTPVRAGLSEPMLDAALARFRLSET